MHRRETDGNIQSSPPLLLLRRERARAIIRRLYRYYRLNENGAFVERMAAPPARARTRVCVYLLERGNTRPGEEMRAVF